LPLVAIAKATGALRSVKDFKTRLRGVEAELQMLKHPPGEPTTERPFAAKEERETAEGEPFVSPAIAPPSRIEPSSVPPPLPEEVITAATSATTPEPPQPPPAKPPAPAPSLSAINWEQFMGAKLFAWIGGLALFLGVAFLLAVRLDAIAVAILGIAGGFLTPILLSTGQDNPFGLFGYIALLDIGLLMVTRRKEWRVLPILGAIGTALMQIGWVTQFFL